MESPRLLENRVALVTGAGQGIGFAIAKDLAKRGAQVIVTDRDGELAETSAAQLSGLGLEAISIAMDVTNEEQVASAFKQVKQSFGKLDILINNAGVAPKHEGKKRFLHEMPVSEWDFVLSVNLRGAFLCTREALPIMMEQRYGRIVNMASRAGRTASKVSGVHYTSSKSGLIGLTRITAMEYASFGITANAVAPGPIETEMLKNLDPETLERQFTSQIPVRRLGKPEDVAEAVAFYSSEVSGFITGTVLDVNGGMFIG